MWEARLRRRCPEDDRILRRHVLDDSGRQIEGDAPWRVDGGCIVSDGAYSAVFVDGEKVAESYGLEEEDRGRIALRMHSRNARIEYCGPRIRSLEVE